MFPRDLTTSNSGVSSGVGLHNFSGGTITLKYLGTAGWEISDGSTFILIDPYLSRINGPPATRPPCSPSKPCFHALAGDTRRAYGMSDIASPDAAVIDAHIQRADFVLITHTHFDHVLDTPYIALKTHATVIGTESTENVMRAYSVPEEQLITVRGGEDYKFGAFSLKVIPSLHSPLAHKHYFSSATAPAGMKAPLTLRQMHPEGGTLAYLIRFNGHQILVFGGMNYIEREVEGFPDDTHQPPISKNGGARKSSLTPVRTEAETYHAIALSFKKFPQKF